MQHLHWRKQKLWIPWSFWWLNDRRCYEISFQFHAWPATFIILNYGLYSEVGAGRGWPGTLRTKWSRYHYLVLQWRQSLLLRIFGVQISLVHEVYSLIKTSILLYYNHSYGTISSQHKATVHSGHLWRETVTLAGTHFPQLFKPRAIYSKYGYNYHEEIPVEQLLFCTVGDEE